MGQDKLPRKSAGGLHRKGSVPLSFPRTLPQLLQVLSPQGPGGLQGIVLLSFSPFLPFLPPNTLGEQPEHFRPLWDIPRLQPEHGVPPSTMGLLRTLTKSAWSRMVDNSAPPGLLFCLLWSQQSGGVVPSSAVDDHPSDLHHHSNGVSSLASVGAKSRTCFPGWMVG